jgi:hypothetical protein
MELAQATQVRERLAKDFGQESIKRLDHYIDIATFMINLPDSAEQRCAQFLEFANTAHKLKDYTNERLNLTGACENATESHDLARSTYSRQAMESIVLRWLDFESQTTRCAFFLAAGLYPVAVQFYNHPRPSEFLEYLTDFERRFPGVDVPLYKAGLFRLAVYAAQNLGDNVAVQRYQNEAETAFAQCPYAVVGGNGTATVDHASDSIEAEVMRENPSLWGKLAVTIVVRWIKAEVKQGLITDQQARELLGMTGRHPTCQHTTSSISNTSNLLEAIDPSELTGELYGTLTPTPPEIWNPRFSRLEEWLRKDGYPPSTRARHRVLDMLQQMRVTSYREFTLGSGIVQDYETMKCIDFEVKRRLALHQSIHPEVAQIDACRFDVASSVLSLANTPRAVVDGVVTDEMMVEAFSVFEDVLSGYRGLGNMPLTYLILNQLSRAMWMR